MRGTHIHEITVYGAQLARLKSVFDPRDDRGINRRPTHLSRSKSGKRKKEMVQEEEEEEEDEVGERPARSFNQTRVLTYIPACISRMGSRLFFLGRTSELSTRRAGICVPTGHERGRSPARRLLFDHQRDLRIVDPLSNHSNRRRPASLIGSVYARGVRRRIAFNIPRRGCRTDSPLRIAKERERKRGKSRVRLSSYRDSGAMATILRYYRR